ncbi:MAG: pilus assembly protein N-terminal domain-containing protein [Ketobacteraceae bacterium]|nr:pilus assembly protein N-terminal domain-containing protein [Ketobacteraceae bacterium]
MTLVKAARLPAVAVVLLFSVFFSLSLQAAEKYADTISIVEGQTRLLKIPGVMRVSIGHPEVANAQATGPDEVLLTGLGEGVTDVRIWKDNGVQMRYLLKVVDTSWVQILEIANIVLADVEGVNAREENGIVFIEGRILRDQDIPIIEDMKQKLKKEADSGSVVFNVVRPNVSLQAMIMMDVQVVEVRRDDLKNIGLEWAESAPGPFFEILGEFHGLGDFDKIDSFLGFGLQENKPEPLTEIGSVIRLLQQKGVARVLAQPKLVTKSGSKAEFLAGGEVPIPIRGNDGDYEVTFKQVGVVLDMEPVADPDGFIATKINVEVSEVDNSVEVLGIPGFTTRRTMMEMNAQSGQTMVISGILKAEDSKSVSKVPGLGSIPILGELFKSRRFQQNTTELVVFVTPYLIDPDNRLNQDMLDYSRDLVRGVDEDLKFDLFD